jgi:hypothetical protein
MTKTDSFWSKCFKYTDGKIILWQNPNFLLWAWLISALLSNLFTSGILHRLFATFAFGTLFAWAYLEIRNGANYFRRALGLVVMVVIVLSRVL